MSPASFFRELHSLLGYVQGRWPRHIGRLCVPKACLPSSEGNICLAPSSSPNHMQPHAHAMWQLGFNSRSCWSEANLVPEQMKREHLEMWLEMAGLGASRQEHTDHIWASHKNRCFGALQRSRLCSSTPELFQVMKPTLHHTASSFSSAFCRGSMSASGYT